MRITACLVVRDEEAHLPACLKSLQTCADELIVIDTGSTDRTPAIAAEFGAQVHFLPWADDFSAARNKAISHATGDWVFHIDADERLMVGHGPLLRQMCEKTEADIYGLGVVCYSPVLDGTCDYPIRTYESLDTMIIHPLMRIHRRLPGIQYQNRCHEQFSPSAEALGGRCVNTAISIWHVGYRESHLKATSKLERNLRIQLLDIAEHPEDPWVHYNLGRTLAALGKLGEADKEFRFAEANSAVDAPWRSVMMRDWDVLKSRAVPA